MSKECEIEILDEVNIKINGLDVITRRTLSNTLKYFVPHAKHTPSYKLGRWDGYERFCTIGGGSYFNLLDKIIPILQNSGYYINVTDNRKEYNFSFEEVNKESFKHVLWPATHDLEFTPIMLRDHQVEVINTFLTNTQSMQEVATGAGKTVITAVLAHRVEPYGRSIVIVPSKDLVSQTEADFRNMGLDVGVFYGDRKEPHHKHVICTWQSIESLDKKGKANDLDFDIEDLIKDVIAVIVDEAHMTKAKVLAKHLTTTFKDVPLRWGLTGTIPKDACDAAYLLCCVGSVSGKLKAKTLQDIGVLSKLHIDIVQINDFKNIFDNYQSELKYLVTDAQRIEFISTIIKGIMEQGNTLILVDRVKTGEMLLDLIPNSVFVNGDLGSTERKKEYSDLKSMDDKTIIATFGVCSTGIDVPRVFNVVLLEAGKSFIKVIQSIGRGLRVAKDKDFVNIYDITSTAKFAKRHLTQRKKFYDDSEYPYSITKVDMPVKVAK